LDFGSARQLLGEESGSLSVILKAGFAPAEQYTKKGNQGYWTDIYALGATVYYMLTGETPDDGLNRMSKDELKIPSQQGISVPPAFENMLKKMMAVKSENRYQNTFELRDAIDELNNPRVTRPIIVVAVATAMIVMLIFAAVIFMEVYG
jgi:serine/threonine protein kinase